VIAEFSGSEGVESSESAEDTALLGKFFIDESGEGSEDDQPRPLDEVHLLE